MKIAMASDHAGYDLKEAVKSFLLEEGYEITDFGSFSREPKDYPDVGHPATRAIVDKHCERGIFICGSGQGMQLVANRYPGIRATVCWSTEIAEMSRRHNDSNVLTMPARFIGADLAIEITKVWLKAPFDGGRHLRRIQKIDQYQP
jgi:ribose 5-phosphate isomerase B